MVIYTHSPSALVWRQSFKPLLRSHCCTCAFPAQIFLPTPSAVLFLTLPFCTSNRYLHGSISNNELLISQICSVHILAHPPLMAQRGSGSKSSKSQVVLDSSISAQPTSNLSGKPVGSTFEVIKDGIAFSHLPRHPSPGSLQQRPHPQPGLPASPLATACLLNTAARGSL